MAWLDELVRAAACKRALTPDGTRDAQAEVSPRACAAAGDAPAAVGELAGA